MQLHENFNLAIEILGTIAFAMSGSFAAMQKRFDPFGVLIIAFVTSVGGGTVPVSYTHLDVYKRQVIKQVTDARYQMINLSLIHI